MNQLVTAAARRHIVEIEKRIAQQWALVEQLITTDNDASEATRTLRTLQQTLALTREHLRFLLREDGDNATPSAISAKQSIGPI
jgi:hypothetical protein